MRTIIFRKRPLLIIKLGLCLLVVFVVLVGVKNYVVHQPMTRSREILPELHLLSVTVDISKSFGQSNPNRLIAREKKTLQIFNQPGKISTEILGKPDQDEQKGIFDNSNISQNDSKILDYLTKHCLHPPVPISLNMDPISNPSELALQLYLLFGNMRNGVFVEAGARNGIFLSNTLALERELDWTGLLVEPNKIIFPELQRARRNAWIANLCLADKIFPYKADFMQRLGSKVNATVELDFAVPPRHDFEKTGTEFVSAGLTECFPLFSILSAINMFQIDYFSLDVGGNELKILKTIPFELVDIKVISVEYFKAPEGKDAIRVFLISKGYQTIMESTTQFIFIKQGFVMASKLANRFLKSIGGLNIDT